MEGFIGEIKYFAGPYAPKNWAFCDGRQLPIVQYTPLYSIIGVQFGGDGKNYFNLPDLRGRITLGTGQSAGTSYRHQGETGGSEQVTLTQLSMPEHTHDVKCDITTGGRKLKITPQDNMCATAVTSRYADGAHGTQLMKNDMVNTEGQNAPHENMPPWTCVNMIICLYGYYPIRP